QTEDSGTWAFDSNETKLKLTSDGDVETYDIVELTATTLKISSTETETVNGVTVTVKLEITLTGK
ncbi:MAG TPA: lipocalin family protein, partial [Cyclobacteriaceae bacterium]